jgi:hypothetical protein
MDYSAHPFVFPLGLKAFSQSIGLPLVNHGRWMDRDSPYRRRFAVSGLAAVDPAFWEEIAAGLKDAGSVAYEQDWLSEIYAHSPELASKAGLGDAYMDAMASAFARRGMSVQYCMPLPLQFLQGSRYGNLTSIRVSDDGFKPDRYHNALFASRLASSLGIWPWCDVFMSRETDSMILALLSAGPVGTGDYLGLEDKANILRAARPDGVLVKPDAALVPTDQAYLDEARGEKRPLVASTWTLHGDLKTVYGVAIKAPDDVSGTVSVDPSEVGAAGPGYFYDVLKGKGRSLDAGAAFPIEFQGGGLAYFEFAPRTACGVALLGDAGKFVGTGKKRIAAMEEAPDGLHVKVLLAQGEKGISIRGYAPRRPRVNVENGTAILAYDGVGGVFTADLEAKAGLEGAGQHELNVVLDAR